MSADLYDIKFCLLFSIVCSVLFIPDIVPTAPIEPRVRGPLKPKTWKKPTKPKRIEDCYNYNCVICRDVCTSKQRYLDHVETHRHQVTPFMCVFCKEEFPSFEEICAHKVEHEALEKPWICEVCGNLSRSKYSLMLHLRIHQDEKQFKCSYCHKSFRQKQHLICHERIHRNERPFVCQICGMSFRFQQSLRNHKKHMHEPCSAKACPYGCGRSFKTATGVKEHVKSKHLKQLDYHCSLCQARFYKDSHIKRHVRNVHKIDGDTSAYFQREKDVRPLLKTELIDNNL